MTNIVWIVVVVIVASLAYWVLTQFSTPEPIGKVARIAIVVIAVLLILGLAANIFGVSTGIPVPS